MLRFDTRGQSLAAGVVFVAAVIAGYANTFRVPFLMDDDHAVVFNTSIQSPLNLAAVLSPPTLSTTSGRPLLNLSYAINHVLGGDSVGGYHAFNLAVHILAGLVLFGVVRRTLARIGKTELEATTTAWLAAFIWALHPVQTASITYISQRAESLMGLLYLTTLYCFIRGSAAAGTSRLLWSCGYVLACAAGVAVKEPIATAPLLVALYDRIFNSSSFRESWRRNAGVFAGLFATWILLAVFMSGTTSSSRGLGSLEAVTPWRYALTESMVVVRYVGLSLWPHPLVFDYGPDFVFTSIRQALPWIPLLVLILATVVFVWKRSPKLGFLGGAFFLLLAPTSSVVPIAFQPMAENRLYLPLAAVAVGIAFVVNRWFGRRSLAIGGILAAVLVALTIARNSAYGTEQRLWEDTLAKWPNNWRAHYSLALVYSKQPDRLADALQHFQETVRLQPNNPDAESNIAGLLQLQPGREAEARQHAELALRLDPNHAFAHANLGLIYLRTGNIPEGVRQLEESVRLKPGDAEAQFTLANALREYTSRSADAQLHYEAAVKLDPQSSVYRNSYAGALYNSGDTAGAIRELQQALKLDPTYEDARNNLNRLTGK